MFIPVLIEQLVITMMGTVQTFMLVKISNEAVSAISLVDQVNQFAYAILNSVSLGATVVVSQYIGSKKPAAAKSTAEQAITAGFAISFLTALIYIIFGSSLFTLFYKVEPDVFDFSMTYIKATAISFPFLSLCTTTSGIIRGTGDSKSPVAISVIMGAANIVFSFLFIFGFKLQVLGAGTAIILSRSIGAIVALRLIIKKNYLRKFQNLLKIRIKYIKQILRIGMFAGMENMIFQAGRTLTQGFYVTSGTAHITANGISASLANILMSPGNSMSIIATTIVGRYMGAGEKKNADKALKNIVLISMAILTVLHVGFLPFAPMVIKLYTTDEVITDLIMIILILNTIAVPLFWSGSFIIFSGMKGAGDVKYTTIVSICTMWAVRVLLGYIFGQAMGFGVTGVWVAMFMDWAARSVFAVVRLMRGKWLDKKVL